MRRKTTEFIGNNIKYFIIAPLLTIAESSTELLLPFLMGRIVDDGLNAENSRNVLYIGLWMIGISLLGLLLGIFSARTSAKASQGYGFNLRQAMFRQIQTFSFADIDTFSTASLVNRCTMDVRQIQDAVMQIIRMLVRAPTLLIVSMVICIRLHAGLSIVYWLAIPALLATLFVIMRITKPFFSAMRTRSDALNACVQENMIAIRVVKTFVRSNYEKEKFRRANDALTDTSIGASIRIALMHPCSTVIFNLATIALYWFGGHLVGSGALLSGALLSYVAYLNNILFSVMMFNMVLTRLSRTKPCLTRCMEVLNYESSIRSENGGEPSSMQGAIRFEHVSFSYPGAQRSGSVLEDICISVKPGEFIAVVGPTGVGKTTFVNLIPRFYDPTKGEIFLDGHNLKDITLKSLRSHVGIVQQDVYLFSGSVYENIAYGRPGASREEVTEAAKAAGAHEFILSLKDGYDTFVGERGVKLSGGQKQRISIARIFLKAPKVLLLDEATAALDNESEHLVSESLDRLSQGRTTLTIAHRLTTIHGADRILVLSGNRIVEEGSHHALMEKKGLYYRLYTSADITC
ncbi:MAG TPA: multidrug ABC transporter ATP-binding protein [Lachnospiraceae bacterium]|nr:multidrug ABC transporter ATP-binding protein [Lachnospiraceae bacterium]